MTRQIVVDIVGDAKNFTKATEDASKAGRNFGGIMQGIAQGIGQGIFNAAVDGVHMVTDAVKKSDEIYRADQVSVTQLGQMLADNIPFWDGNSTSLEQYVANQGKVGFGADETRSSLGQLVGVYHDVKGAIEAQSVAEDFARAHNLDLATATDILAKAHEGNYKALKKYGIEVTPITTAVDALKNSHKTYTTAQLDAAKASDKAATAAEAQAKIHDQSKGAVDAYAQTSQGKLAAAQAVQHDAWVKIGGVVDRFSQYVLPYVAQAFSWVADIVTKYVVPAVENFAKYFQDHLWPAIKQVWDAAVQMGNAFKDFLAPMIKYIKDHFDQLKPVLVVIGIVFAVVLGAVILVIMAVIAIALALVVAIAWVSGKIADWIAYVRAANERDLKAIGGFFSWLGTQAHDLWIKVQDKFNAMVAFVRNLPGTITSAASGMWNGIWSAFKAMLNSIVGAWNSLHLSTPSVDFLGQHIGSQTFRVPQIPYFEQGGTMPYDGLAFLHKNEVVTRAGAARSGGDIHIHIDQGAYIDGPSVDRLANLIAARLRFAPGT